MCFPFSLKIFYLFVINNTYFFTLQRTMRPPAEMMPTNPAEFAAKLTLALEKVKRQRDAEEKLEEKLQRLKEVNTLYTFYLHRYWLYCCISDGFIVDM